MDHPNIYIKHIIARESSYTVSISNCHHFDTYLATGNKYIKNGNHLRKRQQQSSLFAGTHTHTYAHLFISDLIHNHTPCRTIHEIIQSCASPNSMGFWLNTLTFYPSHIFIRFCLQKWCLLLTTLMHIAYFKIENVWQNSQVDIPVVNFVTCDY